jgi:hypothetical protein
MSLTLPRSAAGLALLAALAAGCGTAVGAYHAATPATAAHRHHDSAMTHAAAPPAAMAHHHHHARPMHPAAATPPATAPAQPANPIPQGNGGDQDADNNGGPSDGDGNI